MTCPNCHTDNAALRERAEKAEAERDFERERANKGWKLHQKCHDTMEPKIEKAEARVQELEGALSATIDGLLLMERYQCLPVPAILRNNIEALQKALAKVTL